jgi:hypothetical protein
MRRATILLFALLLVPATGADAKFISARVCGPSDCREVAVSADHTPNHTLSTMMEAAFRSRPASNPPEASPWYRVALCSDRCDSRHSLKLKVLPTAGYEYVPRRGWPKPRRGWDKLDKRAADVYRRITKGLEPFPPSRLLALGATESLSVNEASGQAGIPAWAWIAMAAAAASLVLISRRWLRRWHHSPSAR